MTRLFTRLECERCEKHYGDTMYITGKVSIASGICLECKYREYIEIDYDEDGEKRYIF